MTKISYQGIFFKSESANTIINNDINKLSIINDKLHLIFKVKQTKEALYKL